MNIRSKVAVVAVPAILSVGVLAPNAFGKSAVPSSPIVGTNCQSGFTVGTVSTVLENTTGAVAVSFDIPGYGLVPATKLDGSTKAVAGDTVYASYAVAGPLPAGNVLVYVTGPSQGGNVKKGVLVMTFPISGASC